MYVGNGQMDAAVLALLHTAILDPELPGADIIGRQWQGSPKSQSMVPDTPAVLRNQRTKRHGE